MSPAILGGAMLVVMVGLLVFCIVGSFVVGYLYGAWLTTAVKAVLEDIRHKSRGARRNGSRP